MQNRVQSDHAAPFLSAIRPCAAPQYPGDGMSTASPPTAPTTGDDLAGLIGARICHDLVSPLGAIGNGLELLQMAGATPGPEIALISQSAAAATARLRLFRLAFGTSQPGGRVSRAEVDAILSGLAPAARCLVSWQVPGDLPRDEVRLAFLLLMCLETTLPYGGGITFARSPDHRPDRWTIRAVAARRTFDRSLWDIARGRAAPRGLSPRHVHFGLVPGAVTALGRSLSLHDHDDVLQITA